MTRPIRPNAEELERLYLKERLTTYQIADLFNVSRRQATRWLKKYNIPINRKQRKFEALKTIPFTQRQKDILIGTLLGDSHIGEHGRKNKSCRLICGHCKEQKDFAEWLRIEMSPFTPRLLHKRIDERDGSEMWNFSSLTHNEFRYFRSLFYDENRIKVVRDSVLELVTPLSLAVWFMDDGSGSRYGASFSTEGFTESENHKLADMLKRNFDIEAFVRPYKDRKYFRLCLRNEAGKKLAAIVEPYMVPCMRYKIPGQKESKFYHRRSKTNVSL